MRYPRYTTFRDDELVAVARNLAPKDHPVPDAHALRRQANGATAAPRGTPIAATGRTTLLKEHHCAVTYRDGATGSCRYVRIAPDWHQFQYRHHGNSQTPEADLPPAERFLTGVALPTQRFGERMGNTPDAIEEKARELAASAFADAIRHERQDRFRRATPPFGKKSDPAAFQFSAKRAKEIGGKYALCHRVGTKLLPAGALFDTLEEANAAWEAAGNPELRVACACRWTRRWEIPRINSLYGHHPELREGAV